MSVTNQLTSSEPLTVVGLGEALFDCFSPERLVLGGVPVNLAVHANQLLQARGQGIVASGVGQDELGERLRRELCARGMSLEFLQESVAFPTGIVKVMVNADGEPAYAIVENVAWDHLTFMETWAALAANCSAVCFGTLAQRFAESRQTIREFLSTAKSALRVCDVNLRQQFFSVEVIHTCFQAADVVKLNENELPVVGELLGFRSPAADTDEQITKLLRNFDLSMVALTRGELGTVLFTADERVEGNVPCYPRQEKADHVGAGDACCAAIIVGLLLKKPLQEIVELANRVGAYVASQPGATPELPKEILERV